MWIYEKKLEYPVKIMKTNPQMGMLILDTYGGGDGELGASLRYLSQRFSMPTGETKAILNDIGTEELAHLEMVGSMVHQLFYGVTAKEAVKTSYAGYYADHGNGVYPCNPSGVPFNATSIQSKGEPIADLYEDLAAEQKARAGYEYLIRMADDPDVIEPLKFLREREVVHFQRFGEALRLVQEKMMEKPFYIMKPDGM